VVGDWILFAGQPCFGHWPRTSPLYGAISWR
jgi:hypothetical protein